MKYDVAYIRMMYDVHVRYKEMRRLGIKIFLNYCLIYSRKYKTYLLFNSIK